MASGNVEDELPETVRQYSRKPKKGHHDKNMIKNCWREIAENIGLEDGDVAERLFTNLKKRYNKGTQYSELWNRLFSENSYKCSLYSSLSLKIPHSPKSS